MSGNCRVYLERVGIRPTMHQFRRPVLSPGRNIVMRSPAILTPEQQLINQDLNGPDRAGGTEPWPDEKVVSS